MKTRINKFLAEQGFCSRREADKLVADGEVTINARPARPGDQVTESDVVRVAGRKVGARRPRTYLLLHKPVGLITTTDTSKPDNVISHVNHPTRLFPVGRLDVASSGLLLLTDDGELANRLMHPRYGHEKEYAVQLQRPIGDRDLARLRRGIELDDGRTQPAKVKRTGAKSFHITIREGRNRQIRRMCQALGYDAASLKRIRVAGLKLADLPAGAWRKLSPQEVRGLRSSCGL